MAYLKPYYVYLVARLCVGQTVVSALGISIIHLMFSLFFWFVLVVLQVLSIALLAASCAVLVLYLKQSNNGFTKRRNRKKDTLGTI